MNLIDTHCHLDFPAFDKNRNQILQSCRQLGITGLIIPGVRQKDWQRLLDTSDIQSNLYPALGIHPCFIHEHEDSSLEDLTINLNNYPQILALGEIGLDFFIRNYDEAKQRSFFEIQVELAKTFNLPLIMHVRKAHDQVSSILKKRKFNNGGIVHCYSGSYQQSLRYLDLGFKLGIGGVVTYPRSTRLHKIVKDLPLDSFVLETDAPDIPPLGKEGQHNTPENLTEIFKAFAELRNEALEDISEHLYHNTTSIFPKLIKNRV